MKTKQACPPERRGSGLVFAVVLLFVILGMVITLSSITMLETKMNQKTKSSVGAFYGSESGVEWALNQIATKSGSIASAFSTTGFDGQAAKCPASFGTDTCKVFFLDQDGKVLATSANVDQIKAVRSVGTQGDDTQRAIEAAVASGNCLADFTDTGYGYCITNQQSDLGYEEASQYCATQYKGRLCSMSEWLNACVNNKGDFVNQASFQPPENPGGRQEIIGDMAGANRIMAFNPKNCKLDVASNDETVADDPWPFHCCRDYESH